MSTVLMKKILGDDWQKLPAIIRKHYEIPKGKTLQNKVIGAFFVDFPWYVLPILKIVRLFGGLFATKGKDMTVHITKSVNPDQPDSLFWRREIIVPTGETIVFSSRMDYQKTNELIEMIGFGFGLKLKVTVENNQLVYRSNEHLLQVGNIRLPISDVLFLGHATIIEMAISDSEFELDFRIKHPLFGETYRYGGVFQIA